MSEEEKSIIDFLKKCKEDKDKLIPLLQQSNEILLNYIDKLNNQLQQKENIIKEVKDLFYEKCRLKDSDGRFSFNETDIADFRNLLDKGE